MTVENSNRASGAAIAFIVGSVIFIALAVGVKLLTAAPDIDADANVKRAQALTEIRATEDKTLSQIGWADEPRGLVRLPIETALQKTEQAWQNPAAARADLIARAKKAAAPAPTRPAKPSAFE